MTDRNEITIQEIEFTVADRYAEGHVLTANEAAALNQTRAENLRNNFASKVKAAKTEAEKINSEIDVEALQAALDDYADAYEFGVRKAAAPKDPVMAKALSLAKAAIKTAIRNSGAKVSDYTPEALDEAASRLLDSPQGTEIIEMAKARLSEEKFAAEGALAALPLKAA